MQKRNTSEHRVVGTLHRQQANALVVYLNFYTRLVQVHQKNRWFLNELLQKRDGLVS